MIDTLDGLEVGDLYTTNGKDVWRVGKKRLTTGEVWLEEVETDPKRMRTRCGLRGMPGALILEEFKRLVPEEG